MERPGYRFMLLNLLILIAIAQFADLAARHSVILPFNLILIVWIVLAYLSGRVLRGPSKKSGT